MDVCRRRASSRTQWEADAAGVVHDGVRNETQYEAANSSVSSERIVAVLY